MTRGILVGLLLLREWIEGMYDGFDLRATMDRPITAGTALHVDSPASGRSETLAPGSWCASSTGAIAPLPAATGAWARDAMRQRRMAAAFAPAPDKPPVLPGTRAHADTLGRLHVPYTLDEFDGGHVDRTRERFSRFVLPHFARVLTTP